MVYEVFRAERFFLETATEEQARELFWRAKYEGRDFICPRCGAGEYYQHLSRPEVRTCRKCLKQVRLRAGTILEHSKTRLLTWAKAIYYMMAGKRGISTLELKRLLGMKSYGTLWVMMHKIRQALYQRDEAYKLSGQIELSGATFGRPGDKNLKSVVLEVETRKWFDERHVLREKVGFAKVVKNWGPKPSIQKYWNPSLGPEEFLILSGPDDGSAALGHKEILKRWRPWMHRLVANVRTWLNGTHHGVGNRYFLLYLSEYLYRYNRRHDPDRLFHRALIACSTSHPLTQYALCG